MTYLSHRKSKIHQRTDKNQEHTKPLCIYEMKTHLRQTLEIKNKKTTLSHIASWRQKLITLKILLGTPLLEPKTNKECINCVLSKKI